MTIHIRDNDQTASTEEPQPEMPPSHDDDLMPPPVAETDAADDDGMHTDIDTDDGMHAELDIDDEMDDELASDDGVESRAQGSELEAGSETGSGDESHLELNTGAYGRPESGADMYDAPAPGDDPDTEGASETGVAVGGPETLDVVDEVDLRVAPVEVTTEAGAVPDDASVYGERWNALQTSFVDEPRQAVESADHLVTEAMEQLARALVSQRDSLQAQWRQGDEVDTEQLRVVFQGYRAFLFGLLPT